MQTSKWDDLRVVLALQRAGSLNGAARRLGVDPTTVSRRLEALQTALNADLIQRQGDGALLLTAHGELVAQQAEKMEHLASLIDTGLKAENDTHAGTVRLTSAPIIINRILLPRVQELTSPFPGLKVELLPESRDFSLTKREADIALRLSRPRTGGTQVKARRLADLDYAVYRRANAGIEDPDSVPWIAYDDAMAYLPQSRWIAKRTRGSSEQLSPVRVRDGESALEAVIAGVGKSLVPTVVGDRDARLERDEGQNGGGVVLSRPLWLLAHNDLIDRGSVRAVMSWIDEVFR